MESSHIMTATLATLQATWETFQTFKLDDISTPIELPRSIRYALEVNGAMMQLQTI